MSRQNPIMEIWECFLEEVAYYFSLNGHIELLQGTGGLIRIFFSKYIHSMTSPMLTVKSQSKVGSDYFSSAHIY